MARLQSVRRLGRLASHAATNTFTHTTQATAAAHRRARRHIYFYWILISKQLKRGNYVINDLKDSNQLTCVENV